MTTMAERVAPVRSRPDLPAAEIAAAALLPALGVDLGAPGLARTPLRMAKAYAEMLTPRDFEVTTFDNDEGYDELVVAHLCMSLRGVPAAGARTVTSTLLGCLRDDARSRAEFFAVAGHDR
jgi:GTP cyclohydrolase I